MKQLLLFAAVTFACSSTPKAKAQAAATPSALDATKALAGNYKGHFDTIGPDGTVVSSWDDTVTAENPVLDKDRAYVTVHDTMTFKDGPTVPVTFLEGFLANPDGSAGDHFFDLGQFGGVEIEHALTPTLSVISNLIDDMDLTAMHIDPKSVVSQNNATIRSVVEHDGQHDELITRVTTLLYRDASGKPTEIQFVSMGGHHARVAAPK
jgi:hypothetical protein